MEGVKGGSTIGTVGTQGATMKPGNVVNISETRAARFAKTAETVSSSENINQKEVVLEGKIVQFPSSKASQAEEAERLFDIAEQNGVDEALERLSKDDFLKAIDDLRPRKPLPKDDEVFTDQGQEKDRGLDDGPKSEAKRENSGTNQEESEDERKLSPIEIEVRQLTARAEKLAESNVDFAKKLEHLEEINKYAMMTLFELAQAMNKLLEDPENKKNQSLFVALINAVALLMAKMFVPEEGDGVMDGQSSEERQMEKVA